MNLIKRLSPPPAWKLPVVFLLGIFFGLGLLAVHISRAPSYLSDKPETCINCHVMYPQYASWKHSSHREVATCSDCHVPHDNFVRKYYFKASDGARHATIFSARAEPHVIQIKNAGAGVVQENCIRCHINMVDMTQLVEVTGHMARNDEGKFCWDCHREVPHGTVKSLAAAPHALVPRLPSVYPQWLDDYLRRE
jgi:cytochrome c nitrite reductase small subunit